MLGKNIEVSPRPDGTGFTLTYEEGSGRKVHQFTHVERGESAPHGAGSFHDPEHHRQLMERHDAYLKGQN